MDAYLVLGDRVNIGLHVFPPMLVDPIVDRTESFFLVGHPFIMRGALNSVLARLMVKV